jgi:hypothetical protein
MTILDGCDLFQMLPAQDEKRQDFSNSAIADNLEVFSASKLVGSLGDLQRQLDDVDLGAIAHADQEINRIVGHLKQLEYALEILSTLRSCQHQIDLAVDINHGLAQQGDVQDELLSQPLTASLLLGQGNLITLRSIDCLANEAPAAITQHSTLKMVETKALSPAVAETGSPATLVFDHSDAELAAHEALTTPPVASDEILTINDELPPVIAPLRHPDTPDLTDQAVALPSEGDGTTVPQASSHGAVASPNQAPPSVESATAVSEVSAADNDFDTKLLDDLIKNYGEFATHANPPAAIEPGRKASKDRQEAAPRLQANPLLVRNPNDLDRQLKKLIRDYGENDLYSQNNGQKTKLRVACAFAVLAAVLGGIYYLAIPEPAVAPAASILQGERSSEGAETAPASAAQDGGKEDANSQRPTTANKLSQAIKGTHKK